MEKYKIFGPMERGRSSCIYKAVDFETEEVVCLKREHFFNAEEGVPCSIIREISFLKEMDHRNVIRLLDVVNKERAVHIILEHMELDLRKLMDTSPEIVKKPEVAKSFLHQILSGLAYCHSHKILHRNLKPESLLLDSLKQTTLKIAEFGSARAYDIPAMQFTAGDKFLVETLWYKPPELIYGDWNYYSTPVDVWSVGCIFAEMLIQQPLFEATSQIEHLGKIFRVLGKPKEDYWSGVTSLCECLDSFKVTEPKKLAEVVLDLEPHGVDLLSKMLCLNPKERITASEALMHPYFSRSDSGSPS